MSKISIVKTSQFMSMTVCATLMTACVSHSGNESILTSNPKHNSPIALIVNDEMLSGRWQELNSTWHNENKPPILQFKNGNIYLMNGCNNLWTDYRVQDGQLVVSPNVRSTRMACDDKLMQVDSHISSLLRQGKFSLVQLNNKLVLQINKDDAVHWFTRE